jgi:hypothetical protein
MVSDGNGVCKEIHHVFKANAGAVQLEKWKRHGGENGASCLHLIWVMSFMLVLQ